MSATHGRVGQGGPDSGGSAVGTAEQRASIRRTVRGLLTSSTEPGGSARTTPTGFAHMFGVCMVEFSIMVRGKGSRAEATTKAGMPTFVDVKLTHEEKEDFLAWDLSVDELIRRLELYPFDGYRVGLAWSGEAQSYTASLTCRNDESPNGGLCMTSFAKTSLTALKLMVYKHEVVTKGVWRSDDEADAGAFG